MYNAYHAIFVKKKKIGAGRLNLNIWIIRQTITNAARSWIFRNYIFKLPGR